MSFEGSVDDLLIACNEVYAAWRGHWSSALAGICLYCKVPCFLGKGRQGSRRTLPRSIVQPPPARRLGGRGSSMLKSTNTNILLVSIVSNFKEVQ